MQSLAVGVCTWSINRKDPIASIQVAADRYGVRVVHLGFFDEQTLAATSAEAVRETAQRTGVEISSTFAAFPGENYQNIETVAQTGGYLPDDLFEVRLEMTRRVADLTVELGVRSVAIHVGTVPDDTTCDAYKKLADRAGQAADLLADRGLMLLLETGRESAQTLNRFIDAVGRGNVAVNFDPGNLVLYGADDPVGAIDRYLRVVHEEAAARGYRFDESKLCAAPFGGKLTVTTGQLAYEWGHFRRKLEGRDPERLRAVKGVTVPDPHSLFTVVEGDVEGWERV